MSNLSLMNPGTSLNFDGAALQNQEEAEYRKEEEQQQLELRQLLSNGFDDLLDDDILSVTSDDSINVSGSVDASESGRTPRRKRASGIRSAARSSNKEWGHHHGYQAPPANSRTQLTSHDPRFSQDEFSQPEHDQPTFGDPYKMTAPQTTHDFHVDQFSDNYDQTGSKLKGQGYLQWGGSVENLDLQRGQFEVTEHAQGQDKMQFSVSHFDEVIPQPELIDHRVIVGMERGETDGGNEDFKSETRNQFWSQNYTQHYKDLYRHGEILGGDNSNDQYQNGQNTFGRNFGEIHISFPNGQTLPGEMYGTNPEPGPYSLNVDSNHPQVHYDEHYPSSLPTGGQVKMVRHVMSRHDMETPVQGPSSLQKQDFPESYRVQYKGSNVDQVSSTNQRPNIMESSNQKAPDSQSDFLNQVSESGEEGRQLAQLQILYKARGRQLEELSTELETFKQESAREKRILKHQLSIAQGEKEGAVSSYKQCQDLLQETKDDNAQLLGKLQAVEAQVENLNSTREELLKKLQTAESTIENLTHELSSHQQSDSLSRARSQHEAVVNSMQQKFDKEILDLKERLDAANDAVNQKNSEISSLRQQVHEVTRASEQAQISRAETINRLTRSLEESQKRCQSLLESSSSQELSELKMSLKQAQASKNMSEEMCDTLQEEMKELKEQLSMFESASGLGVFSSSQTRTAHPDDSMTDLGIKKTLDFNTPGSQTNFDGSRSSNDTIVSLKVELERCLSSNRQKRSQVTKLQQELRSAKKEVKVVKENNSSLEKLSEDLKVKLRDYEDMVQPGQQMSAVEMRLKKDVENLTREKEALIEDNEELKKRLDELGASEERLTEINQELTSQISKMVRDYDNDKREALERCQRMCDTVHQDARDMLRQELETDFSVERAHIVTKYESEVAKIRSELQTALREMDSVEQLYVKVGEEKTELEEKLKHFQQEKDNELKLLQDELEHEKEELSRVQSETGVSRDALRAELQLQVTAELEENFKKRLDDELAKARTDWLAGQDTQTLRSEVREEVEKELTLKQEAAVDDLVQARVEQAKVTWMTERKILLESEIQQRLQTERVTWQETANQRLEEAVNTAIDHAREQWLKSGNEEKPNYEELLASSKLTWENEWEKKLEEAVGNAVRNTREEMEKKFKDEEQSRLEELLRKEKTKWQLEADRLHEVDIKQAVEDAKKTWEAEIVGDSSFQHRLQTEKQKWQLEADRKLQLEVSRVTERAQKGLGFSEAEKRNLIEMEVTKRVEAERGHWREKQESDMLLEVEQAVKTAEEEWRKEAEEEKRKMKEVLEEQLGVKLKEEMRKAVEEAKLQWEKDRLSQHATFTASQSAAEVERSILEQEVESLKKERQKFLAELKEKESDWLREKQALISQKDLERREAVREVEDQCEKDYDKFMSDHQDTLTKALHTSRQQQERLQQEKDELQQHYEQKLAKLREKHNDGDLSLSSSGQEDLDGSILEQERHAWQLEAEKLKKSIQNRDTLLKQADKHMSHEVEKLRAELEAAFQSQLEMEVGKLRQRYESEFNDSLPNNEQEMNKIHEQIEKMTENFGKEKAQCMRKIEHLEHDLAEKKESLMHLEQEIKGKYEKEVDHLLTERNNLNHKISEVQSELDKKVRENETLRSSVKNMESAYRRDMKSQKEKLDEINSRLQKSEKSLSEVKKRSSLEVEELKKAVSESEAAMANLTQKMMEKQKANTMMLEAAKKQHKTEKRELLKQLKKYSSDRGMTSTPVQTESSGDIVLDLRSQYLDTVAKIREDVMQHITQTNLRAADTVRTGITREKQVTVAQLKRFYKSSIRKILQGELIGADLEGKLATIDQALEALSISISSSRSVSPDNEVKVNDVAQDRGQSLNSSFSLDGSSGSNLTPRSESSVVSSASSGQSSEVQGQIYKVVLQKSKSKHSEHGITDVEQISTSGTCPSAGKQNTRMVTRTGKEVFPRSSQNLSLFDRSVSRSLDSPSPVESEPVSRNSNVSEPRTDTRQSRAFRPIDHQGQNVMSRSNTRVRSGDGGSSLDKDGFLRPQSPPKKTSIDRCRNGASENQEPKHPRNSSLPPSSSRQRPQLSLLRRSMEDEFSTPKQLKPFSYEGISKAQSELALNTLADFDAPLDGAAPQAVSPGNVQISYKYTSLRQSLQNGSPSTSLFSNHSLSEGDLRITETEDEPVLNLQSLGLGKASPRKFNPVPEKLDGESGYHTPRKSPSNLFGKKMTHSLDNLAVLGLSLEEQSLEEEFTPLAPMESKKTTSKAFREFQKVSSFPVTNQRQSTLSDSKSSPTDRVQRSSSETSSHSYKELHKGRQLKVHDNDSGRASFRSPNVTVRSSLPHSLKSQQ